MAVGLVFDVYAGKPGGCDNAWACATTGSNTDFGWIVAEIATMLVALAAGTLILVFRARQRTAP